MVWEPAREVWDAGEHAQGRLAYVGGSVIGPNETVQRPPGAGAVVLAEYLKAHFEGVNSVGIRRGAAVVKPLIDPVTGLARGRDIHEEGRALDVMIAAKRFGPPVADWLVLNALQLGVQYVIWDSVEWSVSQRGPAWESYHGTNPHTDHVHCEVIPIMAQSATLMREALSHETTEGVQWGKWAALGAAAWFAREVWKRQRRRGRRSTV